MRYFTIVLALAATLMPVCAFACDLDGIYGSRFSAFAGIHRPIQPPETNDAGMPINQISRVPPPLRTIKSDLELQPAEPQPPMVQAATETSKLVVAAGEKDATKPATFSKR